MKQASDIFDGLPDGSEFTGGGRGMERYMTKPAYVEAVRWDESKATLGRTGARLMSCNGHTDTPDLCKDLRIEVCGGVSCVCRGDWIVLVDGEYEIYSDELFRSEFYVIDDKETP